MSNDAPFGGVPLVDWDDCAGVGWLGLPFAISLLNPAMVWQALPIADEINNPFGPQENGYVRDIM